MSPAAVIQRGQSFGSPESPNSEFSTGNTNDVATDNGRVSCDHEHFAMSLADEVLDIDIDEVLTMLFTDSPLFNKFVKRRRTYDVKLADWSTEPDEHGRKLRNIAYTLSINFSIGPKCSPSTERQIMYPESIPGERYLIDAECYNGGVPYCDHFCTVIRYCMTRLSPSATRLIITGRVVFLKNVMGLIKGLLQKTATSGCTESFGVMVDLLREESQSRLPLLKRQGNASRPTSLPLPKRQRMYGQSDGPSPSLSTPQSPDHRVPEPSDCGVVRRRQGKSATTIGLSNHHLHHHDPTASKTILNLITDYFLSLTSSDTNARTVEILVILLFISPTGSGYFSSEVSRKIPTWIFSIVALVVINAALYYQLTALETTLTRSFVSQRGEKPLV